MTAQQTSKLTRYNTVLSQLSAETAAVATIPALKRTVDTATTKAASIKSLMPKQQEGSTGETTNKEGARQQLIEELLVLEAQITAWAEEHNDAIAAQKAAFTPSDFTRMRDAVLPSEGEELYKYAVANKAALADVGITDETLEELAGLIDNFSEKATLPRNKISTRKTHSQNLETLFEEMDKLIDGQIAKLMLRLKKNYPDVYSTFVSNNKVIDTTGPSAKEKAAKAAKKTKATEPPATVANP